MYLNKFDGPDLSLYEQFAAQHGGIFNNVAWKHQLHGDRLQYYGIFTKQGDLCAVFHLYTERRSGLAFVRTPPFMPHSGLVINNRAANPANYLSFNKDVLGALATFLNGLRYAVLSLALPPAVIDTQPLVWNKYKVVPNYTYQHDLTDHEALEDKFSTNVRNSIKKAAKDGVRVEQCYEYDVVADLVRTTFSRREKRLNEHHLTAILRDVATPTNSFAFVARWEDKPVAVAFCIHDESACYYLLGGYDHRAMHRAAGVTCLYNCIRHARDSGLKLFDFEGSMMPEVESYFRSFGPNMVPYYTVNKARLPLELILKFVKREQF